MFLIIYMPIDNVTSIGMVSKNVHILPYHSHLVGEEMVFFNSAASTANIGHIRGARGCSITR
jgi:hypothetical protein